MIAALIRTCSPNPTRRPRARLRAVVDQLMPYAPTVAERLQSMEHDVSLTPCSGGALVQCVFNRVCRSRYRRGCWGPGDDSIGFGIRGFSISVSPR